MKTPGRAVSGFLIGMASLFVADHHALFPANAQDLSWDASCLERIKGTSLQEDFSIEGCRAMSDQEKSELAWLNGVSWGSYSFGSNDWNVLISDSNEGCGTEGDMIKDAIKAMLDNDRFFAYTDGPANEFGGFHTWGHEVWINYDAALYWRAYILSHEAWHHLGHLHRGCRLHCEQFERCMNVPWNGQQRSGFSGWLTALICSAGN